MSFEQKCHYCGTKEPRRIVVGRFKIPVCMVCEKAWRGGRDDAYEEFESQVDALRQARSGIQ